MKRWILVVALAGCSASSSGPAASGDASAGDGASTSFDGSAGSDGSTPMTDAVAPAPDGGGGGDASSSEAGGDGDAGADAGDAAFPCVPLGGSCEASTDCYCGTAAGCAWDNVTCNGNKCAPPSSPPATRSGCCSDCEVAYESGGTFAAWQTCNAGCGGGGCVARCLGP